MCRVKNEGPRSAFTEKALSEIGSEHAIIFSVWLCTGPRCDGRVLQDSKAMLQGDALYGTGASLRAGRRMSLCMQTMRSSTLTCARLHDDRITASEVGVING